MYFSDSWSFLLELNNNTIVPVDLSAEEDWGDIEPVMLLERQVHNSWFGPFPDKRIEKRLSCTIGTDDEDNQRLEIVRIWEYREDKPLNGKFSLFEPVSMVEFVRRYLDASIVFNWDTEEEVAKLKEHYGV